MVSYTDNNPGLTGEQLAPQSIAKGLFSDSLKRENYSIFKNYTDTSLNDLSGTKPILENDIKLSSNDNYVTLFYSNPLMISYTDDHSELSSENPVLQLDKNIRVSTYILSSYKDEWAIPSAEKSILNAKENRSFISFSDTLKLYHNGYYYEPYSINWAGAMALERIGDMLPLDFLPDRKSEDKNDTIFDKTDVRIQDSIKAESALVAEKVYLHTDRDYYYSGDDIWFKAYITDAFTNIPTPYTNNLHVELISDADVFIHGQFITEKLNYDGKQIVIRRGALILLDGYEVYPANLSGVLTLPMNTVDRIDVLNASPLYGMRGANGVINIITRAGPGRDPIGQTSNTASLKIKGFDSPRIFYSPKYDIPGHLSQYIRPDH